MHGLETLQDIKSMMERSSRFISLSGWSGIVAGVCALAGAGWAFYEMGSHRILSGGADDYAVGSIYQVLEKKLIVIALIVFLAAFISELAWRQSIMRRMTT